VIRESINTILENEASYLDISIKNVDKVVTDEKTATQLINQSVDIYGKYDGTKLSLLRTGSDWDDTQWWKMFIVSYKGNIIYGTEYAHAQGDFDTTVGVSQYKSVIDHVAGNFKSWKSVPKNTEFFVEFLMNKPTLTRQYTKLRQLVLIGHGKVTNVSINNGKIDIKTNGLDMSDREKWAKLLGLNLPELIFSGKLIDMPKGLNQRAKEYFKDFENSFKGLPPYGFWELAKNFFMQLPSLYGSIKEEGVVIHLSSAIGNSDIIKIVQDDQYDKELRFSIKMKYKMEINDEDQYWLKVRESASEIIKNLNLTQKFPNVLKDLSQVVYKDLHLDFSHKKKTELNIRDDIQLTSKSMIMRMLPGNNGALVIGKFRVFTNGHKKMFEQALSKSDTLTVSLVTNKETKATLALRTNMIKAVFPEVEVIQAQTGNLITIINKTSNNINTVLAGSDRVVEYRKQLERNLDVQVEEVKRSDDDESATKVIRNLSDVNYFKLNTPKEVYPFYDELIKTYTQGESFRRNSVYMLRKVVELIGGQK